MHTKNLETILEKKLIKAAAEGMRNALTANRNQEDDRFGAAVLTQKGNIYSAGQYFSDTYTLTVHAEQAALIHAAAHGEHEILAIAIIHNKSGDQPIYPCHICKQVLYESYLRTSQNIEILLLDSKGSLKEKIFLLDTISYPWPMKNAK